MDTKEYIKLSHEHDIATRQDYMSYDKIQFINVVVKSQFPELYSEISNNFDDKASEIFAQRECDAHNSDNGEIPWT